MEIEMEKENKSGRFIDDDLKEVLLPPDIITEILSLLPADSVIECRCICKQWRSLIDHHSFRDTHTRQLISSSSPSNPKKFGNYLVPNSCTSSSSSSIFLCAKQDGHRYKLEVIEINDDVGVGDEKSVLEFKPFIKTTKHYDWFSTMLSRVDVLRIKSYNCRSLDTMLMISSCNGLVLMGRSAEPNDMLVCNPFTREYVILRTPIPVTTESAWQRGCMVYGFGYHPCTNEYKVVCIYYDAKRENMGTSNVYVYTLGSGKWRNKGEIPYLLNVTSPYPGMLVNGVIHWLTYNHEIVSFDLADEEFREVIPLLPPSPDSNTDIDQYWVLGGGCLCVSRSDKRSESPRDIWVLNHVLTTNHNNKEEEEVEFSWSKKFSIPGKGVNPWAATPQIVLKSGKILLRCVDGLATYDPKSEAFVEGDGKFFLGDNTSKIIPYTKSFVSLKALGEEHAERWRGFRNLWIFSRRKRNNVISTGFVTTSTPLQKEDFLSKVKDKRQKP